MLHWRRATKIIPELRDMSYEKRIKECGLTTLETRNEMKKLPSRSEANKSTRYHFVILDSGLNMETQVRATLKSAFYHIRNIGLIRQYITDDICKILVQALVTSRLVYGNALPQGSAQKLFESLQRVHNCAARLITRTRKT